MECFTGNKFKQTPVYIPAYSPNLNAIEYAFSVWCSFIKQQFRPDEDSLTQAIHLGSQKITADLCYSFHRTVTHLLSHYCVQGKELPDPDPVPHIDAQQSQQSESKNDDFKG